MLDCHSQKELKKICEIGKFCCEMRNTIGLYSLRILYTFVQHAVITVTIFVVNVATIHAQNTKVLYILYFITFRNETLQFHEY